MKIIVFSLVLITLSFGSFAVDSQSAHQTDGELCTDIMSQEFTELLSDASLPRNSVVRLVYSKGLRLSQTARTILNAHVTSCGNLIADSSGSADYTLDIAVTDVSLVFQKKNDRIERTASMTVHLLATRRTGPEKTVVFASGTTRTARDTLPENLARQTDDSHLFSPEIHRVVIEKSRTGIMAATLLLISGALLYYSSR